MTYSIVALDEGTGALGVAVQSKVLAAGAGVVWAESGIGAIATQAIANRAYGPDGLNLLRAGTDVSAAISQLTGADTMRAHRQVGIVAASGASASFTGDSCIPWAGHRTADRIAAQGNILAGPAVVDDMFEVVTSGRGPFAERLMEALIAAQAAGGDRRGRQAAALMVVPPPGGDPNSRLDLRVDDDEDPITRLQALHGHHRLLMERPETTHLEPLTSTTAAELRQLLGALGAVPERIEEFAIRELMDPEGLAEWDTAPIGTPRPLPEGWTPGWQDVLVAWMVNENLEARLAADGWIDPAVVAHLRSRPRP